MQVAGLQDYRGEGPPGDTGTFQAAVSVIVYQFTFSGTTYTVAQRMGVRGWVLVSQATVAATVIQAAADYVGPLGGGSIFLTRALYLITITVVFNYNNIEIFGNFMWSEQDSYTSTPTKSGLMLANGANCSIFSFTKRKYFVHNLFFWGNRGNNATGSGIITDNVPAMDMHMSDVYVTYFPEEGIKLFGGNGVLYGVYVEGCNDGINMSSPGNVLVGCGAWTNTRYGFIPYSEAAFIGCNFDTNGVQAIRIYGTVTLNLIEGCQFHENLGHCIMLTSGATNNVITGNTIWLNQVDTDDTYAGIYIGSDCTDNLVANNVIRGLITAGKAPKYGIYIGSTALRNSVTDNIIIGTYRTATLLNLGGDTNRIKCNIGFVTENTVLSPAFAIDGVATVTVTIPHGLAITPAIQDCSLTVLENTNVDDWGYNLVKVDSVGAVNVVAKVNVSVASATGGATAKLSLRVGKE